MTRLLCQTQNSVDMALICLVSVWIMKLLEKFEAVARQRRLADNTIDAYRSWIQQFLRSSAMAHGQWKRPEELGTADVEAFLNDLVSRRRLSASSQNQALNALVFLYSQVLDAIPQNHLGKFALLRSTRPKRVRAPQECAPTLAGRQTAEDRAEPAPPDPSRIICRWHHAPNSGVWGRVPNLPLIPTNSARNYQNLPTRYGEEPLY